MNYEISETMKKKMIHEAKSRSRNGIAPAGIKKTLDECFTTDQFPDGKILVQFWYNPIDDETAGTTRAINIIF